MTPAPFLKSVAHSPILLICAFTFACVPGVVVAAWVAGTSIPFALAISLSFALCSAMGVKLIENVDWQPVAAAMGLIGQAIALTAAFSGHAWQTHSHM